ncbi:MAG: TIR domain-containing protein, partial [Vicinamibacterales bacterium]
MSKLHRVFISYHHALDESRKKIFELRFGNSCRAIISAAVGLGDINPELPTETIRQKIRDEHLRDASVTVVLIGRLTWQRKHVDWEISSTIRNTQLNPRGGLLGIVLPSYYEAYYAGKAGKYDSHTIPPRLHDNVVAGYAKIYSWSEDAGEVQGWIHDAY